jgi:DNA-binding response OmpR family regulator
MIFQSSDSREKHLVITDADEQTIPQGAASEPRQIRVLIVDDERDAVETLSAILLMEGYSTFGLYKGSEVLPRMQAINPHAVILDIDLSVGPSGFSIAREIRERYGEHAPLLIAMSGKFKGQIDKLLGHINGFDHYCLKPCEPQELLTLLEPLRNGADPAVLP